MAILQVTAVSNMASGPNHIAGSGTTDDDFVLLSSAANYDKSKDFTIDFGSRTTIPHLSSGGELDNGKFSLPDLKFKDGTTTWTGVTGLPTATFTIPGTSEVITAPIMTAGGRSTQWLGDGVNDSLQDFNIASLYYFKDGAFHKIGYVSENDDGDTALDSIYEATLLVPGANSNNTMGEPITPGSYVVAPAVCFVRGVHIETQNGAVKIEDIQEGDMVQTMDHGFQEVKWIGSTKSAGTGTVAPILFKKGAIGNTRDLMVSPQHRMLISDWRAEVICGASEVLIAAKDLVNDTNILTMDGQEVEYFHMMFDTHEIVFAEGVPSESFHPGEQNLGTMAKASRDEILALFPELESNLESYGSTARDCVRSHEAKAIAGIARA